MTGLYHRGSPIPSPHPPPTNRVQRAVGGGRTAGAGLRGGVGTDGWVDGSNVKAVRHKTHRGRRMDGGWEYPSSTPTYHIQTSHAHKSKKYRVVRAAGVQLHAAGEPAQGGQGPFDRPQTACVVFMGGLLASPRPQTNRGDRLTTSKFHRCAYTYKPQTLHSAVLLAALDLLRAQGVKLVAPPDL